MSAFADALWLWIDALKAEKSEVFGQTQDELALSALERFARLLADNDPQAIRMAARYFLALSQDAGIDHDEYEFALRTASKVFEVDRKPGAPSAALRELRAVESFNLAMEIGATEDQAKIVAYNSYFHGRELNGKFRKLTDKERFEKAIAYLLARGRGHEQAIQLAQEPLTRPGAYESDKKEPRHELSKHACRTERRMEAIVRMLIKHGALERRKPGAKSKTAKPKPLEPEP